MTHSLRSLMLAVTLYCAAMAVARQSWQLTYGGQSGSFYGRTNTAQLLHDLLEPVQD